MSRVNVLPVALMVALLLPVGEVSAQWGGFADVLAIDSGLAQSAFSLDFRFVTHFHVGGAAAGDVDDDGFEDLLLLRGDRSPRLLRNRGDGSFEDVTLASGLGGIGGIPNGALFADVDGNGTLDLLLGGVRLDSNPEAPRTPIRLFTNDGSGVFTDATVGSQLTSPLDAHSMALADVDGSGHLDLAIAYWDVDAGSTQGHLWRNLGDGRFEDISLSSGIGSHYAAELYNFTPNFADIDHDGRPDLLMAADFGNSRVFLNQGGGNFADATGTVISDENGMGATLGDLTNSGRWDWFVTSIFAATPSAQFGTSGNRLYRFDGQAGGFADTTDAAGVREGGWGWGTCAADFDNDGWLDIVMVNGYQSHAPAFLADPARLFINNGDGSFSERALASGLDSSRQGRAVLCFDSNNDGHIDVLIQNSHALGEASAPPQLFRNRGHAAHHWLRVKLRQSAPNSRGVGARVTLQAGGTVQTRELRAGSNYLSSDPIEAHFGLGTAARVDLLSIRWPDGQLERYGPLDADRILVLERRIIFADRFE